VRLVAVWLINTVSLIAVAYLMPTIVITSFSAALIAALVLGLVNTIVRPILVLLTLPVTILTLGLFIFVINALLFWFVAEIVHGFAVTGFGAALVGSILYSILTLITSRLLFPPGR
jgi:putative membrane protein